MQDISSSQELARQAFDAGVDEAIRGDHAAAVERFERAVELDSDNANYHRLAGISNLSAGRIEQAQRWLESALALDPLLADVCAILARLRMPGPDYVELLPRIHRHLRPRTYVEIGVFTGVTLALTPPETRAIGIDPKPIISSPLGPRTTVHAVTSDEYFASHDVQAELGGMPIDLAFIDGMHHFEYALRDFINVEKNCTPRSTILIHDCYPFDRLTAERERHSDFWSGDIWRLVLILKKYRPDLELHTIATAPTGLGVVRKLDPLSRVLEQRLDEIIAEFLAVDYSVLDADKAGMLSLCPNDQS